jgi:cytoplasmic iron level regulating protein YaaA (DUF328/UPF0246 family)
MKILLSPAKTLNFESPKPLNFYSHLRFIKQSEAIDKVLKKKKTYELINLMDISENLAQLNYERNQLRDLKEFTDQNARQAIFAFDGDVYAGFDAYSLKENQIEYTQNTIRILSGLYGLIKPFDLIQPYRLEMGTPMPVGSNKNLYEFWQKKLTKSLSDELATNEYIINLASKEYASAIKLKSFGAQVITPEFKEFKNGKYSVISFFAKKARGQMARYIVDHQIENVENIKAFNMDNYRFDANLSKGHHWVFTR